MENQNSINEEKGNDVNHVLATGIRECLPNKCKQRDNKFGATWCVRCGKLFTKLCGKDLKESDKVVYAC